MASKSKENLSEADAAYKEELDSLVLELLTKDLSGPESEAILLKLVDHATNDFGNISTIPKALQFLVAHKLALDEYYKRYTLRNGEDTCALVLVLELVSFLEAINLTETPKKGAEEGAKKEEPEKVETPSFKLLLYRLEANLVAARLLALDHASPGRNLLNGHSHEGGSVKGAVLNGFSKETVEFRDRKPSTYKLSQQARTLLEKRKVSDWGNEYLISLSSQIVAYFSLPSTRQHYLTFLARHKDLPGRDLYSKDGLSKEKQLGGATVVLENNLNLVILETLKLIEEMTTYWLANGFEFDAIDLLLEVDRIESIGDKCSDDYDLVTRVSSYLASISFYGATYGETARILQVTYALLFRNRRFVEATRVALKLNDYARVVQVLASCKDLNVLKQVALVLSTSGVYLGTLKGYPQLLAPFPDLDSARMSLDSGRMSLDTGRVGLDTGRMGVDSTKGVLDSSRMSLDPHLEFDETVLFLNSGENKSALFLSLCKELDVLEPKHPSDVFKGYPSKSNLSLNQTLSGVSIDSARDNLSYTLVSALINCGTSSEKLINPPVTTKTGTSPTAAQNAKEKREGEWVFKHQGYGLMCASASLGLVHLWNLDEGLSGIDRYQYSTDQYVRSGAFVAFGLVSSGVVSELDPIQGLLVDKLDSNNFLERLGAVLGLGFAYAGTNRMDLLELLIPQVIDLSSLECSLFSSLALSVIFVGTGNQESCEAILQVLMEYLSSFDGAEGEKDKKTPALKYVRVYLLSLGLLQLCRGEMCEPVLEALKVLGRLEKVATTLVESFAYATSGDVLKIQSLLKNLIVQTTHRESKNEADMEVDPQDTRVANQGPNSSAVGTSDVSANPTTTTTTTTTETTTTTTTTTNTTTSTSTESNVVVDGIVTMSSADNSTTNDTTSNTTTSTTTTGPTTRTTTGATTGLTTGPTTSNISSTNRAERKTKGGKDKREERVDKKDEKTEKRDEREEELLGLSVLCIALISLGENIGSGMLVRLLEHPLQCGSVQERRAVPLAVALVNVSNPAPQIVSLLSKLTHDSDREVSLNAVLALGLVGAGTNNSRVSQIFQSIAKHSYRDSLLMFVLRVGVGLLFMGKGTLTLAPLHSEGFLLNKQALSGLAAVLFASLDLRSLVCEEFPFLLLFLGLAIRPRWLMTLNTDLEVVNVPVRVGTFVDTIGTAGRQRKVSGFQTHKSPVLIGVGERAELATEDMESLSPYLEGVVLVAPSN